MPSSEVYAQKGRFPEFVTIANGDRLGSLPGVVHKRGKSGCPNLLRSRMLAGRRSAGLGSTNGNGRVVAGRQVCGEFLFPKFNHVMIYVTGNRIEHEKVMMRRPAAVIV